MQQWDLAIFLHVKVIDDEEQPKYEVDSVDFKKLTDYCHIKSFKILVPTVASLQIVDKE